MRTVERALVAQTREGELAVGLGSFDAARVVARLWERLLPPRGRGEGARGVARVEGMLGHARVAVAVDAACGAAAWAEGDTRLVDRILAARAPAPGDDSPAVLLAHAEVGDARSRELLGALASRTTSVDVEGAIADAGLALDLTLRGAFAPQTLGLRARVALITRSELLRAMGADAWARGDAVTTRAGDASLSLRLTLPGPRSTRSRTCCAVASRRGRLTIRKVFDASRGE